MTDKLALSGDANVPAMPMEEAQVNHLRRLLAWMRLEYTLDEDMQRGYLLGAHASVAQGFATPEAASAIVQAKADQINQVPAYVRQGVKMLTKALREHEKKAGVVDSPSKEREVPQMTEEQKALHQGMRESGMFTVENAAKLYSKESEVEGMPPIKSAAWLRNDGMKAMPADEKAAWIEAGQSEIAADYTIPLYAADQVREAILMERERCAKVCDEVQRQQDNDNGVADTGGARTSAAAIRKG
jgi:hypothetical protein